MQTTSFNIIDQPTFLALLKTGEIEEMGIEKLLKRSSSILRIIGDTPLQEFVVVRLLLAVLYRSLKGPKDTEDWLKLWELGIPMGPVQGYLEKWYHRFDLLSPKNPFYQIVDARYATLTLIPDNLSIILDMQKSDGVEPNFKYITSSCTKKGIEKLSFAEATRKLIELQNYNVASLRPTLIGDPRIKKKSYAQLGWAGNLGGILLLGQDLHQTLLLNLVPFESFPEVDFDYDLPVWEREQQTTAPEGLHGPEAESRNPSGPSDLYTSQGSRVTLKTDGEFIVGATTGIGDRLLKYDKHIYEPMSSWKFTKRTGAPAAYSPIKVRSSHVWRGLESLLAMEPKTQEILSKNLSFFLEVEEYIDADLKSRANILIYEVSYGKYDAVINEVFNSQLSLPAQVLASKDQASLDTIISATRISENVNKLIKTLHVDIFVAEGKERKPVKGVSPYLLATPYSDIFLADAGVEFQRWVSEVTVSNYAQKYKEWVLLMRTMGLTHSQETMQLASVSAMAGVSEQAGRRTNIFTAIKKFNSILYKITEIEEISG